MFSQEAASGEPILASVTLKFDEKVVQSDEE